MSSDGMSDKELKDILLKYTKYTVVGISPKEDRASFGVTEFMKSKGYQTIGVNPGHKEIGGRPCYSSLSEALEKAPDYCRMLDVFRSIDAIPALVDSILQLKAKPEVLWLQLGITHVEAEKKAKAAGIKVVSDRCLIIEHRRLMS